MMKIEMHKRTLETAVGKVKRAAPLRTTGLLENIRISAEPDKVTFTGSNGIMTVVTAVQCSTKEEGEFLVNAGLLADIVRKLPDDVMYLNHDEVKNKLVIEALGTKLNLNTISADEYLKIPEINDEVIELPAETFAGRLEQIISFAAEESNNIDILKGIQFLFKSDHLRLTAIDGYRIATAKLSVHGDIPADAEIIVPKRCIKELLNLYNGEEKVKIAFSGNQVRFSFGTTKLYSILLVGSYINYEKIIPEKSKTEVVANRKALLGACDRCAVFKDQHRSATVKCDLKKDCLELESYDAFNGSVVEKVTYEEDLIGDPLQIAFNTCYLIDALKAVSNDNVRMRFSGRVSPMLLTTDEDPDIKMVILPIRLSN